MEKVTLSKNHIFMASGISLLLTVLVVIVIALYIAYKPKIVSPLPMGASMKIIFEENSRGLNSFGNTEASSSVQPSEDP